MQFKFDNSGEGRALLRAIIAAKFTETPQDKDVLASPPLATIAWQIRSAVEKDDLEELGDQAAKSWARWSKFDENREDWNIALKNGAKIFRDFWHTWSGDSQIANCRYLLSPFVVQDDVIHRFVSAIQQEITAR